MPDGGWPAEERYYKRVTADIALGNDYVGWGGVGKTKMNEWVTADALQVLTRFGRLGRLPSRLFNDGHQSATGWGVLSGLVE